MVSEFGPAALSSWFDRVAQRIRAGAQCACLAGALCAGQAAALESTENLIDRIAQAHQRGEFQLAWAAYREYYRQPHKDDHDLADCLLADVDGCPSIGSLGLLLGKLKSSALFVEAHCTTRPDACDHWELYEFDLLPDALAPSPPTLKLPLGLRPYPESRAIGNVGPHIAFSAGAHVGHALIDTGFTYSFAATEEFSQAVAPPNAIFVRDTVVVGSQLRRIARRLMVLSRMDVSGGTYYAMPVIVSKKETTPNKPSHTIDIDILGMGLLLRHRSVCFSWRESLLYLGEMGPCADGVQPFSAQLTGEFGLLLEVRSDGESKWATVDTGAERTPCPLEFKQAPMQSYRFGPHADMTMTCEWDGVMEALIGIDTLYRFTAFGWELDPLRVYFVPADDNHKRE